ncbi:MAG: hypothetical protein WA989_01490 [Henriciella sp.]|uniref:lipopolysaccharide assembly protein LapA domain-containing protein n=1 Tax=Henriciella sp. TaxID=1968823 RepID=UPI003C75DCB6
MKSAKTWLALILLGLLAIFAVQNIAIIEVKFLGTGFETRRIFLILISVLVGFALGKAVRFRRG